MLHANHVNVAVWQLVIGHFEEYPHISIHVIYGAFQMSQESSDSILSDFLLDSYGSVSVTITNFFYLLRKTVGQTAGRQ